MGNFHKKHKQKFSIMLALMLVFQLALSMLPTFKHTFAEEGKGEAFQETALDESNSAVEEDNQGTVDGESEGFVDDVDEAVEGEEPGKEDMASEGNLDEEDAVVEEETEDIEHQKGADNEENEKTPNSEAQSLGEGDDGDRNLDQTDNTDIERSLELKYRLKGEGGFIDLPSDGKIGDISKIDKFWAKYKFELVDHDGDEGQAKRTVKEGDFYLIDLPKEIQLEGPVSGTINDDEGKTIANYSIYKVGNSWQVKVEFTDYVDDPERWEIHGELEFEFDLDTSGIGDGETGTIEIPIDNEDSVKIEITKPEPEPTVPTTLQKWTGSYDQKKRELTWVIRMGPETANFEGATITDTLTEHNREIVGIWHGSQPLIEGEDGDYTYNPATGEISYTIPEGRNGAAFQDITIKTRVSGDVYEKTGKTTITNKANLTDTDRDVDVDSNEATHEITPDWLKKRGTLYEGNRILWTIDVNENQQPMYDVVVTDRFSADVELDKDSVKVGSEKISVYDKSHTPKDDKEIYGILTKNTDGTSELKVYFPRGRENASSNKQTITLVTDIATPWDEMEPIDPENSGEKIKYNNEAFIEGKFDKGGDEPGTIPGGGGTGIIGVNVPAVNVWKGNETLTAEDKSQGTITWIIKAVSNYSDYKKSEITDTLPNDQDYIEGEIEWHNKSEGKWVKLDSTTEPRALISEDGRTLTISFEATDNALRTQQDFKVKTKIKPEVYGDNINREFKNNVGVKIYDSEGNSLAEDDAEHRVRIKNTLISKNSIEYNGNITGQGENPRVNFSITINDNLMPLKDVVVTDNLNDIVTEFKEAGGAFKKVDGVKWTMVDGSLKVERVNTGSENSDLSGSASKNYNPESNTITVSFGEGIVVEDKYKITFTAELDVNSEDEAYAAFKKNGVIRLKGNKAEIKSAGIKPGGVITPPTGDSNEIRNEILGKRGVHEREDQQIVWTININQHRIMLENTKIMDILPKGLTLDPTSIKLYKNVIDSKGNFITGDEIKVGGNGGKVEEADMAYTYGPAQGEGMEGRYALEVTLPDNKTDYILRFATDIDAGLIGKTIENKAFFVGQESQEIESGSGTVNISGSASGGSTRKTLATVEKRDSENGELLDGAQFTLNWLKNMGSEDEPKYKPEFVRTLTAENGKVTFYGLTIGERYSITEVTAPDGYEIDDPKAYEFEAERDAKLEFIFKDTPIKSGSWMPKAIKKLEGKNIIRPFEFEILDNENNVVMTGGTEETGKRESPIEFKLVEGKEPEGILNFTNSYTFKDSDSIGKEQPVGKYTFTLKEVISDAPGYGFDATPQTLNVKVYNVKGLEELKVVVEDSEGNELTDDDGNFIEGKLPTFTNTYDADGAIELNVEKTVEGHSIEEDIFSFELYEVIDDEEKLIETQSSKGGQLVEGTTHKGNVYFTTIPYTIGDVGTKTYKVVEKDTGAPGYTYDKAVYTIEVSIEDPHDNGELRVTKKILKTLENETTEVDSIGFTNTYTTKDTTLNLGANKTLSGRNLEDEQFLFRFNQVTAEGDLIGELGIVKNDEDGAIVLPELSYTQEDIGSTYYYEVSEIDDGKPGYLYDNTLYTVEVEILDNHNGTIRPQVTYSRGEEEVEDLVFNNSYQAEGKALVTAHKTLTGKGLLEDQFTFALQQVDIETGEAIVEAILAKNDKDGQIIFPELTYTEEDAGKDFYYTLSELNEELPGYTYDEEVYTLHISVADNGDGTLSIEQGIIKPEHAEEIDFTNTYTTSDTIVSIQAKKSLDGGKLSKDQFTFVLSQKDEEGKYIEIQKATNDRKGLVSFKDIQYTQEDMGKAYYYRLVEINDGQTGYVYDEAVYTIKVDVIDGGDGTLKTETSIFKEEGDKATEVEAIEFINKYEKPEEPIKPDEDQLPKTGQMARLGIYLAGAILILLGVLLRRKKRA